MFHSGQALWNMPYRKTTGQITTFLAKLWRQRRAMTSRLDSAVNGAPLGVRVAQAPSPQGTL
ncbi:hypothetical protein NC77_19155 [Janthinobacterium lividum]|nr:hypothetical protein NC77_19155 [Janthinobacterium lividum]